MKSPFSLWNRGGIFYCRLRNGKWETTGERTRARALDVAITKCLEQGEKLNGNELVTLRRFTANFFTWDACPRIAHLRLKGRRISPEHAQAQRRILERYILQDSLADLPLSAIDRPAVDAFERRLTAKLGIVEGSSRHRRLFNSVLVALSTIFKWGMRQKACRENPVGGELLSYTKQERGIFTTLELKALFPEKTSELGPWRTLRDKAAFLVAANGGLRRSELRALTWGAVDLNLRLLTIRQAFKSGDRVGAPKSGKTRYVKLTDSTTRHLEAWRLTTPYKRPQDFAFHHADGASLGVQWWELAFNAAMAKLGIDRKARSIVPHSLRHSLNSHLRAAGVPDFLIRESLGWSSEGVQASYSHILAEHLEPFAQAVQEMLG